MSQDSGVLPAFRSLAIFIAFASALYFLLVWNPVGSLSDVRNYFEHRVRVPVEWIAMAFPVAWLIQRNDGYTTAAAVFVPISVLILTLTKPDYGAEFWRIFRYEIYLNPVYAKRGLLVCFLLLSIVVLSRIRWNHRVAPSPWIPRQPEITVRFHALVQGVGIWETCGRQLARQPCRQPALG
jgi:hypothetical protein